jgi:hypothetical protein
MTKFIINVSVFSALLMAGILGVFFIADGKSDSYYSRFTTSLQHSLIIGTSRAAQGLQPSVFNEVLYKDKAHHFFNYSFSLIDSPFGPAYYESIKRKLNPNVKDGIFIIAVDPWALSSTNEDPNDSLHFIENKRFIGKTKFVDINPNIPYLVESYAEPYINIIRKWRGFADLYVHKDGWLEVVVSMDSTAVAERLENKIKDYRANFLPRYKFSSVRQNYLVKTISFLQNHGNVYLVRLPVQQSILDIENELMPDFDEKINNIAGKLDVKYLNFKLMENKYQYVDGNHLYQSSGREVSYKIANWIAEKKLY